MLISATLITLNSQAKPEREDRDKNRMPPAPDQIIERLRHQRYDMLAIGAYGHSKLRQFFIGSTTSALIHASPVPVLLSK